MMLKVSHNIHISRDIAVLIPTTFQGVPLTMDHLVRDPRTRALILQDEVVLAFVFKRPRLMRMIARQASGRVHAEAIDEGPTCIFALSASDVVKDCRAKFMDFARG